MKQTNEVPQRKENLPFDALERDMLGDHAGRITREDAITALILEIIFNAWSLYENNNRIPGIMEILGEKINRYQNDLFLQLFYDLFLPRIVHQINDRANVITRNHRRSLLLKTYDDKIKFKNRFMNLKRNIESDSITDLYNEPIPEKKIIFRKGSHRTKTKNTSYNNRNFFVNKK